MALTCIANIYDSLDTLYDRYLDQIDLENKRNEDILTDRLARASLLINLIKICEVEGETDLVSTYCTELQTLLNYTS